MQEKEYKTAVTEIESEVKILTTSYVAPFINHRITESLELLVEFISQSYVVVFKDGKVMKLSIFNIIAWWQFLKLSYSFITKLVSIWK